ncbi:hypothetical protein [Tenacibaculum sp. A30]|uniref:hypothetical protein n=1 Tax=Tenacibaculum sp. A30 TaxID=3442644 RepID=UPI003EB71F9D
MELDNKIVFRVICNKKEDLESSLKWYNSRKKTDFEITNYILDEVNFAEITASNFSFTDIFRIGYAYGVKEEKLRERGEIDW